MPSSMITTSLEDQAISIISPGKFHQVITIPSTDSHGPLKVTYSIIGPQFGDVPAILFIAGMFGARWMGIGMEHLAVKEGVRIIFIDRPGFGGSTQVPIHLRIPVYLETIPLLLSHLKIKHLALLASHSSGTIYALNVLHHLPQLLTPSNPQVMLFGPWVHQSISSVSFLQAAALLPNTLLNQWNGLINFIVNSALPNPAIHSSIGAFGASSGFITSLGRIWSGGEKKSKAEKAKEKADEEEKCIDLFGFSMAMKTQLGETIMKFMFAENTQGGNDEARLCLKSVPNINWDAFESLPECIAQLGDTWGEKVKQPGCAKLKVQLVFAESDVMIGAKGRRYFEECWTKEGLGEGIEVDVMEVKGGDHESIIDPMMGAIPAMIRAAKT